MRKVAASSSSSSSSSSDTSSDESDSEVVVAPLVVTTAGKGSMARGFSPGGGGNRAAIAEALSGQQARCIFSTALQRNPELGFVDLSEKQSVHVNGKSSFLCSQPLMTVKGTGYIAKVIAECHDLNALLFLSESDPRVAGWVASTRAGGVFRFIVDNAALTTGVGDAATWVVLKNASRMEFVERLPSVSLRDISTPGYPMFGGGHVTEITVVAVASNMVGEDLVVELVDASYDPADGVKCAIVVPRRVLVAKFGVQKDPVGKKMKITFPNVQQEGIDECVTMLVFDMATELRVLAVADLPDAEWLRLVDREHAWQRATAGKMSCSPSAAFASPSRASSSVVNLPPSREHLLLERVALLEAALYSSGGGVSQGALPGNAAVAKAARKVAKKAAKVAAAKAYRAEQIAAFVAKLDASQAKKARKW